MKYIIFGASKWGSYALDFLGHPRVKCFVDNYKGGTEYCGIEVIAFDTLLSMELEEIMLVIAAQNSWGEMEVQLKSHHIKKYFIFNERHMGLWAHILPNYFLNKQFESVTYNRLLAYHKIMEYKRIAIIGANELLPYLISEIAIQNSFNSICEVITFDDKEYQTIGIPCVRWKEALKDYDCLVINCRKTQEGLDEILTYSGDDIKVVDIYDSDCTETSFRHPELLRYKDIYKGKRVFLIGNGPSLTVEDLEKLHEHGEICVACNKIYRIYEKTGWRADYIIFSDYRVIADCIEDIKKLQGNVIMADNYNWTYDAYDNPYFESVQYVHWFFDEYYPNYPRFSEDIRYGVHCGYTVLYDIGLQLIAYMGASEIYLLGADNTYTSDITDSANHFIKDYFRKGERDKYKSIKFEKEKADKAFEKAEIYSKKKGFRIYNATRGGALEAFERVDFDSLFDEK